MGLALLIDDDETLLRSIARLADLTGLNLETASNWAEGLNLFHVLAPNLVIADYHMPDSRYGLQLLSEVKQLRPSVRVVLVSGFINDQDVESVESLGIVDRALRKVDATETNREIMEEIRAANEGDHARTDWIAFARARIGMTKESIESLDNLDEFFKENRAP